MVLPSLGLCLLPFTTPSVEQYIMNCCPQSQPILTGFLFLKHTIWFIVYDFKCSNCYSRLIGLTGLPSLHAFFFHITYAEISYPSTNLVFFSLSPVCEFLLISCLIFLKKRIKKADSVRFPRFFRTFALLKRHGFFDEKYEIFSKIEIQFWTGRFVILN